MKLFLPDRLICINLLAWMREFLFYAYKTVFGKNQYANSSFVLLIKHESNYCYTWKRHHLLSNECSCQCCFFIIYFMFVIFLLSVAKHLESANTMFSFIWWIIGFYWVSAGGQDLAQDSPQLYWFALSQSLSFWLLTFILINNSFVIHSSFGYSTLILAQYFLTQFTCFAGYV